MLIAQSQLGTMMRKTMDVLALTFDEICRCMYVMMKVITLIREFDDRFCYFDQLDLLFEEQETDIRELRRKCVECRKTKPCSF